MHNHNHNHIPPSPPSSSLTSLIQLPDAELHYVTDIDMYSEFVITMIIPAVGLLLIFLFYRSWAWRIQRSAMSTSTGDGSTDAEEGALHGQDAGLEPNSDTMAGHNGRGARDLCTWLAIGWLSMMNLAPSKSRILCISLTVCCPPQVYTILRRTSFQSFACMDIDEDGSFHHNE